MLAALYYRVNFAYVYGQIRHLLGDKRTRAGFGSGRTHAVHRGLQQRSVADFCLFRAGCARIRGFKDEISLPFATVSSLRYHVWHVSSSALAREANAVAQIRAHNAHSDTQGRVPIKII